MPESAADFLRYELTATIAGRVTRTDFPTFEACRAHVLTLPGWHQGLAAVRVRDRLTRQHGPMNATGRVRWSHRK